MSNINRRQLLQGIGGFTVGTVIINQHRILEAATPRIEIHVTDSQGKPLDSKILDNLYFLNLQDHPIPELPRQVTQGKLFSDSPQFPFAIALKMLVEGFGEVTLYADNKGQGYSSTDFPLNLNLAFAETRIYRVSQAVSVWKKEAIQFPNTLESRLEKAKAYYNKALNTDDIYLKAKWFNSSIVESLKAGEEAVFLQAKQKITARKNFLFGCNFFGYPEKGEEYNQRFKELFNFATIPFYWKYFEPKLGQKNWPNINQRVTWLQQHDITPKGHPLVWFHEIGIPDEVRKKSYDEIKTLIARHIEEVTRYYRGKINYFDIINEPHGILWANELGYSLEQFVELTQIASEASYKGNPEIIRIINNCCLWAENVAYGKPPQHSPYEYLQNCLRNNIPFEFIGLQLYYPEQDMFEINRLLERFGQLGKPIHITELGVSSSTKTDESSYFKEPIGLWHFPWSETVQADWIEQFYTICYSKNYIYGISWWDLADGGSFMPYGGLLNKDMSPKIGFYRLKELLNQWNKIN
ncbi:1,4-beta-xylanase [Aphanothece hegewaldii CCALA 016]|uniref:1,4-beta-xylanase n=1 Tax=Aphanothece hegewaldii CCALA 016 TaxID=2107694 RepID=A0A2T1M0D7_9CHRO|nr:endo-1,4-beta-xylanase [Aphanothece hegewaldii]PSF38112.1 1,4-beta-xylanase [Aphanothece hegewaldii CCALA 016]